MHEREVGSICTEKYQHLAPKFIKIPDGDLYLWLLVVYIWGWYCIAWLCTVCICTSWILYIVEYNICKKLKMLIIDSNNGFIW